MKTLPLRDIGQRLCFRESVFIISKPENINKDYDYILLIG